MKSIVRNFGFMLMLVAFFSIPSAALRQSQPSAQKGAAAPASSSGTSTDAAAKPESSTPNQEVTHAANEAAGRGLQEAEGGKHPEESEAKDEEAAFKYSAAVRGIARITGLSLTTVYWLCVVINFAIIALFVLFIMKSNVPAMLRNRTQEIQKGIEDARRASEDAGHRLREVEARLARLSSEIESMQK